MTSRIESAPAAERYFCTLSPLCKRIISNVQTIRTLHADGWDELSYADQCQVIDGHMVNQETADHWRRLSRQPWRRRPQRLELDPAEGGGGRGPGDGTDGTVAGRARGTLLLAHAQSGARGRQLPAGRAGVAYAPAVVRRP
ncbi:uncharacterized protein LOC119094007 [Pollicipes pollicipes]|uniref:uncharacterized protein LOC119094007 n=1 Tax=Pollicipes pollicipes TaxID=41117 RepID=UPI001884D724|nr:uncharacterized protein LOC119094007 [Pollicipes pollicipes]